MILGKVRRPLLNDVRAPSGMCSRARQKMEPNPIGNIHLYVILDKAIKAVLVPRKVTVEVLICF